MIVYLDKNTKRLNGLAVKFPYSQKDVATIKAVLGLSWDKTQSAWISDGPEVLLDMQRFGIKISGLSSDAKRIAEAFRQELWAIMDARAEETDEEYGYQKQGSKILSVSPRFLLGDDMGIGKTKQTLDAIAELDLHSVLVLAPKTLTYNWLDEIDKWHPEFSAGVVPDANSDKHMDRRDFWQNPPEIVVCNYEKTILKDWPIGRQWQLVVADEATRLKSSTTSTYKAVRKIANQSERLWSLTGTPLEIKIMELYNIMGMLRPSVLGNYMRFRDQHMITDWAGHPVGVRNLELLRERIGPFMLRRTKAEVLSQLPAKLPPIQVYVKMNPREQREYQKLILEFDKWLEERDVGGSSNPMVKTVRARQFCCSPNILNHFLMRGSKYEALLELLEEHSGKVVIFSSLEECTTRLATWLEKDVGYNPRAYISGAVDAQERIARAKGFNEDQLGDIFISTDAGQQGINLVGADMVVHYDQLWNPQKMHQREDRLHRIGQRSSVTVVDLLCMDSIDVGMWELNREREKLFEEVVEGAEEIMLQKLSSSRLHRIIEGRLTSRRRRDEE